MSDTLNYTIPEIDTGDIAHLETGDAAVSLPGLNPGDVITYAFGYSEPGFVLPFRMQIIGPGAGNISFFNFGPEAFALFHGKLYITVNVISRAGSSG